MNDFDVILKILRPWLGDVQPFNLPVNPNDICVLVEVSGCGFSQLVWQKNNANPAWIKPLWKTPSGVICPRCKSEIQALCRSHRINTYTMTGAPFVFCRCVRLAPSRLPSLSFFYLALGHGPGSAQLFRKPHPHENPTPHPMNTQFQIKLTPEAELGHLVTITAGLLASNQCVPSVGPQVANGNGEPILAKDAARQLLNQLRADVEWNVELEPQNYAGTPADELPTA
jgi:hypothetical protein